MPGFDPDSAEVSTLADIRGLLLVKERRGQRWLPLTREGTILQLIYVAGFLVQVNSKHLKATVGSSEECARHFTGL